MVRKKVLAQHQTLMKIWMHFTKFSQEQKESMARSPLQSVWKKVKEENVDIKIKAEDQNFDHKLASLKVVKRERCVVSGYLIVWAPIDVLTMVLKASLALSPVTTRSASDRKPSGHTIQLTRHVKITQEIYVDYTDVSSALSFKIQGTLAVMPIKCPLMPNHFLR